MEHRRMRDYTSDLSNGLRTQCLVLRRHNSQARLPGQLYHRRAVAVDFGDLDRFFKAHRRHDRRDAFGQHALAAAGRANH